MYLISDLCYVCLYKIGRYRTTVVRRNLANSFPDKNLADRKQIEKKFYRQLFDLMVESIKGFSLSQKSIDKRVKLVNSSEYLEWLAAGKSCLVVGGHYSNWEWAALAASSFSDSKVAVLYSPIKNIYIDQYIQKKRSKHDTQLVSNHKAAKMFKQFKNTSTAYVMIADQSPSNPKRAHWLTFLNQETAVLRGPASYAKNYDLAFMYVHISRIKRGYYHVEVIPLNMHPSDTKANHLSQQYMQQLEKMIRQEPANWLWSHKRWKHRPLKD